MASAAVQPPPPDVPAIPHAGPSRRQYEPRAPLVNQVDADNLDDGVGLMLAERVTNVLCRLHSPLEDALKPEIELALKMLCFGAGILGPSAASPGAALQNLRLASTSRPGRPPRSQLLLYLVLHPPLLPTYVLSRLRTAALSRQWPDLPAHDRRRKAWTWLVRAENAARAWELAGWLWFLWDGRYPSILMRLLGLRLVPSSPRLARMVSYEFMNRQLVWGVMTEFLIFALPRIPSLPAALNPVKIFSPVTAFLSQPTTIDYEALSAAHAATSAARKAGTAVPTAAHAGMLAGIPLSVCPACYLRRTSTSVELPGTDIALPPLSGSGDEEQRDNEDRIFVPAQTDCWGECKYCYYCIADALAQHAQRFALEGGDESAAKWTCLRCGGAVTKATRVGALPLPAPQGESESESSESERERSATDDEWEKIAVQ